MNNKPSTASSKKLLWKEPPEWGGAVLLVASFAPFVVWGLLQCCCEPLVSSASAWPWTSSDDVEVGTSGAARDSSRVAGEPGEPVSNPVASGGNGGLSGAGIDVTWNIGDGNGGGGGRRAELVPLDSGGAQVRFRFSKDEAWTLGPILPDAKIDKTGTPPKAISPTKIYVRRDPWEIFLRTDRDSEQNVDFAHLEPDPDRPGALRFGGKSRRISEQTARGLIEPERQPRGVP